MRSKFVVPEGESAHGLRVYGHWTGRHAYMPAPRLGYMELGSAPKPETLWQQFWHGVHHGRLMRYPWLSVLRFAFGSLYWRNWSMLCWQSPRGRARQARLERRDDDLPWFRPRRTETA